jgi:unsaturated rhamnogalacturonyl hydrolase
MKEFLPKSAAKMADCLMKRYGLLTSRWSYDYGVAWRGMEALYAMTGEKKYFDYIKDAMDTFVTDESGAIRDYTLDEFNLDYICNGRQLLYLCKATGDKKYLRAADVLRDQLRRQPRTSDGGFWHKKCYPYQMWLDGLHMSAPFYVEYCLMAEDDAGIRDAAKQLQLAYEHTYEPKTRLNHHGWDESRAQQWSDPETGRSAHAWGRTMLSSGGWVLADENGNLLRVRCQIIDDAPCGVDMLLHFTGTCLTVQARKSFDPATNAYEGVASGYAE